VESVAEVVDPEVAEPGAHHRLDLDRRHKTAAPHTGVRGMMMMMMMMMMMTMGMVMMMMGVVVVAMMTTTVPHLKFLR
jgi:hypothetical protein